jgi:hypothetical protein
MRENRTNAINMSLLHSSRVFGVHKKKMQTVDPKELMRLNPAMGI